MNVPTDSVGFDVGNSTIKAGWFGKGSVDGVRVARHHSSETVEEFVDLALSERPFRRAFIATVNKTASDRLREVLLSRSIDVGRVYESDGSLFEEGLVGCGVDTPRTTGVDRILASLAALCQSPGQDVIVVTCGSAITVNLMTRDGAFQGGAILPGLGLMARSLHEGTAALPRITCPPPPESQGVDGTDRFLPTVPGRSTISAMRLGIYYAGVGAIDRLIHELLIIHPKAEVFLTGGDADLLSRGLKASHQNQPALVLEGLREIAFARHR
ncbi:type III pantothenate kinase [bacterium]|nr:type III pantothenate kinase [bacterium]